MLIFFFNLKRKTVRDLLAFVNFNKTNEDNRRMARGKNAEKKKHNTNRNINRIQSEKKICAQQLKENYFDPFVLTLAVFSHKPCTVVLMYVAFQIPAPTN